MHIEYCATGEEPFRSTLAEFDADPDIEGIFALSAANDAPVSPAIDETLADLSTPVFGGIFPEIIFAGDTKERGVVVLGLHVAPDVTTITPNDDTIDLESSQRAADETMFVFVDAYAEKSETFIDKLFNAYGVGYNYLGGGAGTLADDRQLCLFTNEGLTHGAAVVARIPRKSTIGVRHGWTEIGGPFEITAADGRTVHAIDRQPAYEVYSEIVERETGKYIDRENFFEIAKSHPFGISRLGGEQIVRDPFDVAADGSLTCFGDLPEGEFVHILEGNAETLINAADSAYNAAAGRDPADTVLFTFDCISRAQYLDDTFSQELAALSNNRDAVGALTIGEVANDGSGHLDYYNKTAVVGEIADI